MSWWLTFSVNIGIGILVGAATLLYTQYYSLTPIHVNESGRDRRRRSSESGRDRRRRSSKFEQKINRRNEHATSSNNGDDDVRRNTDDEREDIPLEQLFDEVDGYAEMGEQHQLLAVVRLDLFEDRLGKNSEFLWRMARAYRNISILHQLNGNPEKTINNLKKALVYAQEAVLYDGININGRKWLGLIHFELGLRSDDIDEKYKHFHDFFSHSTKALEDGDDCDISHAIGVFRYEVWKSSNDITIIENDIDDPSLKEALDDLENAESLKQSKKNRLYLAMVNFSSESSTEAIKWLKKAFSMECVTVDDNLAEGKIIELANEKELMSFLTD